jgi:hypothetical protein
MWSPDGRQLFFAQQGRLQTASLTNQPGTLTNPTTLLAGGFVGPGTADERGWDMMPDGRIISVIRRDQTESGPPVGPQIQVVLNWFTELKRLVTTK